MNPRGVAIFALVLAVATGVAWFWLGRGTAPEFDLTGPEVSPQAGPAEHSPSGHAPTLAAPGATPPEPQTPASTSPESVPVTTSVAPGMPLVRTGGAPSRGGGNAGAARGRPVVSRPETPSEVQADMEGVQFMLRDFRTRMGENPVGSNAEIMRAVMGGNEAKARLGPPPGQSLNGEGELVDRWGTPYFFHQLSKTSMEIRSAGPDGRLWTVDDLVTK